LGKEGKGGFVTGLEQFAEMVEEDIYKRRLTPTLTPTLNLIRSITFSPIVCQACEGVPDIDTQADYNHRRHRSDRTRSSRRGPKPP